MPGEQARWGLVGLRLKGKLKGELHIMLRNRLAQVGQSLRVSKASVPKHQNSEKKKTWLIHSFSQGGVGFTL